MTNPIEEAPDVGGGGLDELVPVTYIYDPALGSPTSTQALGGTTVSVPKSKIPLPRRGRLFGQPGFGRQSTVPDPSQPAAPPTVAMTVRWEWVLLGDVDPLDAFVDSLTGRGGWVDQAARGVVKTMISRLYSAGIPRTTITNQIPQFMTAVRSEIVAEQAAPPSP